MCKTLGVLILCGAMVAGQAQTPPLSSQTAALIRGVDRLRPQAHISVLLAPGEERFGDLLSHDQESFTFYDVDRKVNVTLRYQEVKVVRKGYGGYNPFRHRHVDLRREEVIAAVAIVGLAVLIVAAARAN